MKRPSPNDLHTAAQWLDLHEGAEDAEVCKRVAKWLLGQSDATEFRIACRNAGVPVAKAKKALRANQ